MSNEITRVCQLSVSNGPLVDAIRASGQFDQTTGVESGNEFSAVTTGTGTEINYGAITPGSEGVIQMQNLDQANFVEIGIIVAAAFCPFARLYPGANSAPGPSHQFDIAPGVALWAKADTGACLVKYLMLQL